MRSRRGRRYRASGRVLGTRSRSGNPDLGSRRGRLRRYYDRGAIEGKGERVAEVAARSAAFRLMLLDTPDDEDLWLRYIGFLVIFFSFSSNSDRRGRSIIYIDATVRD